MVNLTDKEFYKISYFIKKHYGIDLSGKKILVEGRLQYVLSRKNFKSFSEYYNYISKNLEGETLKEMIERLTANYTFFMRERQHFYYFKNVVLPYFYEHTERNR